MACGTDTASTPARSQATRPSPFQRRLRLQMRHQFTVNRVPLLKRVKLSLENTDVPFELSARAFAAVRPRHEVRLSGRTADVTALHHDAVPARLTAGTETEEGPEPSGVGGREPGAFLPSPGG